MVKIETLTQCILKSVRKVTGVYKITSPSGRVYVGSSIDIAERIKHYIQLDCKAQIKLYSSFLKYGVDTHLFEVLEVCPIENLFKLERHYGELYNVLTTGLNLSLPGDGEVKGLISEESKEKRSIRQTGAGNHYYGKKHSPEARAKISAAAAYKSPETIIKMREAQLGKTASQETKNKMAISQSGRTHGLQTKEKMRLSSHLIKWVLSLETGIYYLGVREAGVAHGYKEKHLRGMLNGKNRNRTSLVYV